ncbi:MAG: D-arabinono-1,4-lactone oxidase [Myxococcota bacterium]
MDPISDAADREQLARRLADPASLDAETVAAAVDWAVSGDRLDLLRDAIGAPTEGLAERSTEALEAPASSLRWHNWAGNRKVKAVASLDPRSATRGQIADFVRQAAAAQKTVRAVGSGHSFSDVVESDGYLIAPRASPWSADVPILDATPDATWRADWLSRARQADPGASWVRLAANAKLREVNVALHEKQLAFANLGSAVFQTVAGVISTSTHGSGIGLPPIADAVASLLMVGEGGDLVRLEPSDGITDPAAHRAAHPDVRLEQSDDAFDAALVSFGCFGVLIEVVVKVLPRYLLEQTRQRTTWRKLAVELGAGQHLGERHFEWVVNPYPRPDGDLDVVTTTRRLSSASAPIPAAHRPSSFLTWLARQSAVQDLLVYLLRVMPEAIRGVLDRGFAELVKESPYTDWSHRVFDLDEVNDFKAMSSELAFEVDAGFAWLDIVETILSIARDDHAHGLHPTAPIAFRFTAPSRALLSMSAGRPSLYVELPQLYRPRGGTDVDRLARLLQSFEAGTERFGVRPHWGQVNERRGAAWVAHAYPRLATWLRQLLRWNASGRFDNPTVARLGLRALAERLVRQPPGDGELPERELTPQAVARLASGLVEAPDDARERELPAPDVYALGPAELRLRAAELTAMGDATLASFQSTLASSALRDLPLGQLRAWLDMLARGGLADVGAEEAPRPPEPPPAGFTFPGSGTFPIDMRSYKFEDGADLAAWTSETAGYEIQRFLGSLDTVPPTRPDPLAAAGAPGSLVYTSTTGTNEVAIFGDWGTGEYYARYVALHMAAAKADLAGAIHLGDIYYAGRGFEVADYVEAPLRAVGLLGALPLWFLNGNHEMMSSGQAYEDMIARWRRDHSAVQRQETSQFALRLPGVQIVGIDTAGYSDGRYADKKSRAWLGRRLDEGRKEGWVNVVCSQHAPYKWWKSDPTRLLGDMKPFLPSIDVWLWGDDHYCALFDAAPERDLPFVGVCAGHGGMPTKRVLEPSKCRAPAAWVERAPRFPPPIKAKTDFGRNGFVRMRVEGGKVQLRFVDWMRNERATAECGHAMNAFHVLKVTPADGA